MKTMSNYLIIMLSILLFIFRLIVVFTGSLDIEFAVKPINISLEIPFLFIMLISIILMSKNKLSGVIILLVSSILYYCPSLINLFRNFQIVNLNYGIQMIVSIIGIIIPIFAFFIIAFAKEQEKRPVDKKTDFFYKNEAYDRKYDERADKNNYRTM